jgi:hypothetical protein
MNSAQNEENKAKVLQNEIQKEQASVSSLQHDMSNEDEPDKIESLQKDIDSKNQIISSLQQKYEEHMKAADRLRQQASGERQSEQQEQLRHEKENQDSLMKKGAKEAISRGFFG